MQLKLIKKRIQIIPMQYPEGFENMFIEFTYEHGTKHLVPVLYINEHRILEGNKQWVNLTEALRKHKSTDEVTFKVLLKDFEGSILHTYTGNLPIHNYILFGPKPIRIDYEAYIHELEQEIKRLRDEGGIV